MRFSLARIMTHPQSHHGQPPTTIQIGKKRAKQAGKVRIPKRTLRKSMVNEAYRIFLGVYTNWTYYLMAYIRYIKFKCVINPIRVSQ